MSKPTVVHQAVSGARRFTPEDLWAIPRVGNPQSSPDGANFVTAVTTWGPGQSHSETRLWLGSADGSSCQPITAESQKASNPQWSPDGSQVAYASKPHDDKEAKPQLHVLTIDSGEPELLIDLPLGVLDAKWLPDGSGLILATTLIQQHATIEATRKELSRRKDDPVQVHATEQRLFRFWDQWLTDQETAFFFHLDLASGECRSLTPQLNAWLSFMSPSGQFDISPDGKEIAFAGLVVNEDRNEIDSRIFTVDLSGTGQTDQAANPVKCLTAHAPAGCVRPRYTPDGKSIVYGRMEDRYFYADRARILRYDRASNKHKAWCENWDQAPSDWEFRSDGALVFTAEHDGRTHLYTLSPESDTPTLAAQGGRISGPSLASDGGVLCAFQSIQQPAEVYRIDAGDSSLTQVTEFTKEALDGVALGEVREVRCQGAEGAEVQAYVVLPPEFDDSSPAPMVDVIHGGPHGIWGDEFHYRWNSHLFAAPGNVVALPNFQGSTSWGNDFSSRIQGEWGKRPFADIMAVTDHLIDLGWADPDRLAAAGGSYGGYMIAWIAGHTDRFRCLVNHAGVYNTLSMYASDATWGRPRSFGGEPWKNIAAIDAYNPARFTADYNTPMLVIHGEQDFRVPVTQGLECYGVLQGKGVPARLVHFPDENHWILKRHNSLRWYEEVTSWLERWMKS